MSIHDDQELIKTYLDSDLFNEMYVFSKEMTMNLAKNIRYEIWRRDKEIAKLQAELKQFRSGGK